MTTIPEVGIEVPDIHHVGVVVEDLAEGMDRYRTILGVSSWRVYDFEPPGWTDTMYRGEEIQYSMRLGLGELGDGGTIELIEPLDGESSYTDHLDAHGEGLHHVACFSFDDPGGVVQSFEAAGIPVLQSGSFHGVDIWYLDTAEALNGLVFETAGNLGAMPAPDATYP